MTRIFFDANLLFSAAHRPLGKTSQFILGSGRDRYACLYSAAVLEEAVRNLKKKHPTGLKALGPLLACMEMVALSVDRPCPIDLPPKDRHVLLAAMAGKADVLLTGDLKDFGPFMNKPKQSAGILIQTFTQFIAGETR